MSTIRGGVEQSRERLVALVLLLQRAWQYGAVDPRGDPSRSQDRRVPGVGQGSRRRSVPTKGPTRRCAKSSNGTRPVFATWASISRPSPTTTVRWATGSTQERLRAAALTSLPPRNGSSSWPCAFCGFGTSGRVQCLRRSPGERRWPGGFELLHPGTARVAICGAALAFDYHSRRTSKARLVEPLVIDVFNGATYLVARVKGTDEIKGYRFSRMTSMPVVLPTPLRRR